MEPPVAPFYLLYRTGLAPTNGTSVQVARLLAGMEDSAIHLLWDTGEAGSSSVRQSIVLQDGSRGDGMTADALDRESELGPWWAGEEVNRTRLRYVLESFSAPATRAWMLCGNERDAARAMAIWKALDEPPLLLHVMDIFHNEVSSRVTPQLLRLIEAANQVACTSAAAAREVQRHCPRQVHVLTCCSNFSAIGRRSFDAPLSIALTGTLWDKSMWNSSPALDVFVEAWPRLKAVYPGVELHYAGAFAQHLPAVLRDDAQNHGYLQPSECEQLLRNCHLAYLPVSLNTKFGPYSVPSRIADYLACGLPTITCTAPGTGIYDFVAALPQGISENVQTAAQLVDAVIRLGGDARRWNEASTRAADYAKRALHADVIRSQLLDYLGRS